MWCVCALVIRSLTTESLRFVLCTLRKVEVDFKTFGLNTLDLVSVGFFARVLPRVGIVYYSIGREDHLTGFQINLPRFWRHVQCELRSPTGTWRRWRTRVASSFGISLCVKPPHFRPSPRPRSRLVSIASLLLFLRLRAHLSWKCLWVVRRVHGLDCLDIVPIKCSHSCVWCEQSRSWCCSTCHKYVWRAAANNFSANLFNLSQFFSAWCVCILLCTEKRHIVLCATRNVFCLSVLIVVAAVACRRRIAFEFSAPSWCRWVDSVAEQLVGLLIPHNCAHFLAFAFVSAHFYVTFGSQFSETIPRIGVMFRVGCVAKLFCSTSSSQFFRLSFLGASFVRLSSILSQFLSTLLMVASMPLTVICQTLSRAGKVISLRTYSSTAVSGLLSHYPARLCFQ